MSAATSPTPPPLLLVDDDVAFRQRLARALAARGRPCMAVADTAAALGELARTPFSGAIVDLRVPPDGGLVVVEAMSRKQPAVPVVVLTGFGSIATALEAVRRGARDYLTKPATPDELLAALESRPRVPDNPKEVPPETPTLDRVEWEHIQRVLQDCGGNISQAARLLGLDRRTLQRKLAKYPPPR